MDDNKIVITDNNGEENVFEILFTYEDEENGNKYVMYYSEDDDEQIFASRMMMIIIYTISKIQLNGSV